MAQVGVSTWLASAVDSAVKPRRTTDGQKLLLLTATPAAVVLGIFLLRHASHRSSLFASAPSTFTDAGQ